MHAVLLTKINPTEAKRLIREHCAVRGITCDYFLLSGKGKEDHAAYCHQHRYLDRAASGRRMSRPPARSVYEVRRADLVVNAVRRSDLLP